MSRLKDRTRQYEEENDPRWIRIHLTGFQAFLCVVVFFLSLSCVFVAGVLTGRGVSKESREALTVTGTFYRLLGLKSAEDEPVDNASETWIPPEKILASLESEKELISSQKPARSAPLRLPAAPESSQVSSPPMVKPNLTEHPVPPLTAHEGPSDSGPKASTSTEAYTLMVASMRREENATALVERLKKKGHKAAVEKIALSDQDVWYRVILGSFDSRQKALEYAARLNKEENLQAIVIRREGTSSGGN
ncbi:SPOR domain-containing protein [Desulfosoma caldarium]|uniref:Sporulation related protein n=1 Tax=Desulfosoma caldarium TaxID=610254 RepID=A0A3N1UWB6_9BACT|nr:SPOR domain-containing protein [Desulfosoma caldarium]ROQ92211.1 sporulation related protein [Desulfosoma caldarium]